MEFTLLNERTSEKDLIVSTLVKPFVLKTQRCHLLVGRKIEGNAIIR